MRIGIDGRAAKWYRGTGIGTYTYELVNSLNSVDNKNDYLVFMPDNCKDSLNLNRNFIQANITETAEGSFWDVVNIPNILKDYKIDLYHVPQNGIGLPVEKECPFLITLHDVIPFKMPETVSKSYLKIFTENIPSIIERCDGIVTVSDYSKKDIVETLNFPEEKIFVTYLANEDIYIPIDKILSRYIIKKNYSITDKYILYVGGFSPRKNILGLIEAFSILMEKYHENIKLVIAGRKGSSYETYKSRAEELNIDDKVLFPGFIALDDLPYLYNASELFIYPSFYEGFGLPPIEAMACGVPVIASDTTSIPEIAGDSARLIDPQNTSDMAEAMLNVLQDENLRNDLIQKGLKRSRQLSWKNTARQMLNVYEKFSNNK